MPLAIAAVRDLLSRIEGRHICYAWIADEFKQQGLTQHDLQRLAGRGLLQRDYAVRGGGRVYYLVPDLPVWRVDHAVAS